MPIEDFITVEEFLEQLRGVASRELVYRRLRSGELPGIKFGRRWLTRRDALDQLLASHGQSGS